MTTKNQERKALEQIRKIVENLGDDSYIGTAFEGCFEIAEENINNDFACSMKERAEAAEKNIELARKKYEEVKAKLDQTEEWNEGWHRKCDAMQATINKMQEQIDQKNAELHEEKVARGLTEVDRIKTDDEIKNLKAEIIKLKAKLYDMIVKED